MLPMKHLENMNYDLISTMEVVLPSRFFALHLTGFIKYRDKLYMRRTGSKDIILCSQEVKKIFEKAIHF